MRNRLIVIFGVCFINTSNAWQLELFESKHNNGHDDCKAWNQSRTRIGRVTQIVSTGSIAITNLGLVHDSCHIFARITSGRIPTKSTIVGQSCTKVMIILKIQKFTRFEIWGLKTDFLTWFDDATTSMAGQTLDSSTVRILNWTFTIRHFIRMAFYSWKK